MSNPAKTRVGLIGCGNISKAYFPILQKFPHLDLVACADARLESAKEKAEQFSVPSVLSTGDLIAHPGIDLVVNLTIPQAHAEIDHACLQAGKHVFSEKPFALTTAEAREICDAGGAAGRRIGCAPDTVLGAGVQTCRKIIDEGKIGRPVSFVANVRCRGHEHWHPSPEFYYQKGGGPLFDMGPYYLHALTWLLGPVKAVYATAQTTFPQRPILSEPKKGTVMNVEVPTHVMALLEYANGATGTLAMSFDLRGKHSNPIIEIYGDAGSLAVPDPNTFGGVPRFSSGTDDWIDLPLVPGYAEPSRGLGAADMAAALASGRDHRANERIALHCVDVMESIHESARLGRRLEIRSTCERPAPMPSDLPLFTLD